MFINMFNSMMTRLGDMVVGAAVLLVVLVAPALVPADGLASLTGASETASAAPASAPDRSYRPGDAEPFYAVYVAPEDMDRDTGEPLSLYGVAIRALIDDGAMGAVNDGADAFVYARVGTVADFGHGTATVTAFGLRICTDGDDALCSGTEFDPWSPES